MDSGANPFAQNNRLFYNACLTQNLSLVKFLISIEANCTEPDNKPIYLAFYNYGYIELKKLLLDNGADPNAVIVDEQRRADCGEKYILDRAICNCDLASCELLLEYGADIGLCQIKSKYSMIGPGPSCCYCCEHEDERKIINLLKNHGLDIDNSDC